ncbi:HhH domain-containing protein [Cryptosporidium canis]|uniref:HhH domain-containing protein n=1 Tax=Cryptosporidium canis TaxID=195482 RepID=A0A9D5DH82_9CRYT|nr:HhH domain-containing protein [Cryptosporidium canis]
MVHGISKDIKSQKLINIYDINSRTYLFKFGGEEKKFLLVESGIRFHTTSWKRENEQKASVSSISFFNGKLRRYIRNKRLEDISQMGMDRIIKLTFGFGENTFYLIFEFFVAGNIILTDCNYKVLVILRDTSDLSVGKYYIWKDCEDVLSPSRSPSLSKPLVSKLSNDPLQLLNIWKNSNYMKDELRKILNELENNDSKNEDSDLLCSKNRRKANKHNSGVTTLEVFSRVIKSFHLSILENLLESENIAGNELFTSSMIDETSEKFIKCINKASDALSSILSHNYKGILVIEVPSEKEILDSDTVLLNHISNTEKYGHCSKEKVYISYSPYVEGHGWISTPQNIPKEGIVISRISNSFCDCVDEFYSSIDIVKEAKITTQEQKTIYSKVDKVKIDQERRLEGLSTEREACIARARLMESQQDILEKILQLIRHLIATGAQWQDIWNEIQQQKKNNHQLAKFIKSLHLEEDKVKIIFSPADLNMDISEVGNLGKNMEFDLLISKSIQSNIRLQYLEGKNLAEKLEKTRNAYKIALKKVTNLANKDAEKVSRGLAHNIPKIKKLRVQYWFEKFYWFISSDGFLIIGGHDASQNELLFRRYLEKNDRYIHADIHGATTCIIKNPNNISEIPLNTLCEAGQMSICYSKAWVNKTVISAWWVYPDQVSKTAPSGEYLTTGSFVIRGKKNFLPPLRLEMGCALYFIKSKQSLKETDGIEEDKQILLSMQSSITPEISALEEYSRVDSEKMSVTQVKSDSGDDADEESESESDSLIKASKERHSGSTHVRFSVGDVSDIIPPLKIEHRVQFDELPPELLLSKPFNPLSIDEASNQTSSVNSVESLCNITNKVSMDSNSSESESDNTKIDDFHINVSCPDEQSYPKTEIKSPNYLSTPINSSRRSSVDEGPPPIGFSASTLPTPAELLSHKVEFPVVLSSSSSEEILDGTACANKLEISNLGPGVANTNNAESDIDLLKNIGMLPPKSTPASDNSSKDPVSHDEFNNKLRENYRRRSIDGGPTPRGFIPDHVPSARELLQKIRFDPVDLELEHLSHMRERGRFISDAVPYLPEELQRLIMVSNQNSNKKHRFTIDTNVGLFTRTEYKNLVALDLNKTAPDDQNSESKSEIKKQSTVKLTKTTLEATSACVGSGKNDVPNKKTKNNIPRGKKSKLKKVADKYGEQDDEERKIKMMLFGSKEMKGVHENRLDHLDKDNNISNNQSKPLHISQQEKRRKEQERMERFYKNRTVDNTVENREFQYFKNSLLPTNDDDSEIIAVIPTFAPYTCIKDFKYCARLTPGGTVKRSKAAQDIINHFSNTGYKEKDQKPNSYEHIKALKISDIIKNLMNPVKIQFSNEKEKSLINVRNDRS